MPHAQKGRQEHGPQLSGPSASSSSSPASTAAAGPATISSSLARAPTLSFTFLSASGCAASMRSTSAASRTRTSSALIGRDSTRCAQQRTHVVSGFDAHERTAVSPRSEALSQPSSCHRTRSATAASDARMINLRSAATVRRLAMYKQRAVRDKKGKILKQDLQSKELPSTRIVPDRRWFGNV